MEDELSSNTEYFSCKCPKHRSFAPAVHLQHTVQRNASISSLFSRNSAKSPQSHGKLTKVICQCCLLITRSAYHLWYMAFGKSWQERTYKLTLPKTWAICFYFICLLSWLLFRKPKKRFLFLESFSQESVSLMMLSLVISWWDLAYS